MPFRQVPSDWHEPRMGPEQRPTDKEVPEVKREEAKVKGTESVKWDTRGR